MARVGTQDVRQRRACSGRDGGNSDGGGGDCSAASGRQCGGIYRRGSGGRDGVQPWGYLYGLIWPSHTETIHSYLLLSSVTLGLSLRERNPSDVNRLERCIVHLQDECKLSLICELHASLALSKDLLTFGPRLSRCHLAWALAALLRPYRPYLLVPCAPVTIYCSRHDFSKKKRKIDLKAPACKFW